MATLCLVDFKLPEKTEVALPDMKEQIKNNLKNLNLSDEDLETILRFAYQQGFHDGIIDFKKVLNDQGFKVIDNE